jgi:hypothetical protein
VLDLNTQCLMIILSMGTKVRASHVQVSGFSPFSQRLRAQPRVLTGMRRNGIAAWRTETLPPLSFSVGVFVSKGLVLPSSARNASKLALL